MPRVFLGIRDTCTRTRALTKYWRVHRQTERPAKVMALFSCFLMPNN